MTATGAAAQRLGGLDVRFLPDGAARVGALRSGEMHVINQIPVAQLPNLRDRHLLDIPLPRRVSLHLINAAGRPFADPGQRAAARAAVDPRQIAGSVYEGRADPTRAPRWPSSECSPCTNRDHPRSGRHLPRSRQDSVPHVTQLIRSGGFVPI